MTTTFWLEARGLEAQKPLKKRQKPEKRDKPGDKRDKCDKWKRDQ